MNARLIVAYRHAFRRPRLDRRGLWPRLTLGWWSVEFLPGCVGERMLGLLGELRQRVTP